MQYKGHDIESRMFKNRDKQMTFIVRVRWSFIFILISSGHRICRIIDDIPDFIWVKACSC